MGWFRKEDETMAQAERIKLLEEAEKIFGSRASLQGHFLKDIRNCAEEVKKEASSFELKIDEALSALGIDFEKMVNKSKKLAERKKRLSTALPALKTKKETLEAQIVLAEFDSSLDLELYKKDLKILEKDIKKVIDEEVRIKTVTIPSSLVANRSINFAYLFNNSKYADFVDGDFCWCIYYCFVLCYK